MGFGVGFIAHQMDGCRRGADENNVSVGAGLGEAGALGEEAIAGMDGIGASRMRGFDQFGLVEIGGGGIARAKGDGAIGQGDVGGVAIRFAKYGDGSVAVGLGGANDARGDFAAIGDQDAADRVGHGAIDQEGGRRAMKAAMPSSASGLRALAMK